MHRFKKQRSSSFWFIKVINKNCPMMLPWDSSCGLPFKPRTFLYLCPCFKDHPKSYMWDKMENHIILCQTPTPSKKKKNERSLKFYPKHPHAFICKHHLWFTLTIFNFKYYVGEWYYHKNWLQTHFIHFHMSVGINL